MLVMVALTRESAERQAVPHKVSTFLNLCVCFDELMCEDVTAPRRSQTDLLSGIRARASAYVALYKDIIHFEFVQSRNTSCKDSRVSSIDNILT